MAVVQNELFFAPGFPMRCLEWDDSQAVVDAFEARLKGFFIAPIHTLECNPQPLEGSLFAAALLVAALIESVSRTECQEFSDPISAWLEAHLPEFRTTVRVRGRDETLASIFATRFRHGLAHNGHVASLGRLSADLTEPVAVDGDVVTVNPFLLAHAVADECHQFCEGLRNGSRDVRRFIFLLRDRFDPEVQRVRSETL